MSRVRTVLTPARHRLSSVVGGRFGAAPMLVLALLPVAGCAGHASVRMISMGIKKISATRPLVIEIEPDSCSYWINDSGDLCVAMRESRSSLLGKGFSREFNLSLVLKEPPAGSARNYRADRQTLRSRRRVGYSHTRSASLLGIVAVWDHGKARLRGRFRISAKQQSYLVLTGWGGATRVLLVGEFNAAYDREAGERILALTEEDGMDRRQKDQAPTPVRGPSRKQHEDQKARP